MFGRKKKIAELKVRVFVMKNGQVDHDQTPLWERRDDNIIHYTFQCRSCYRLWPGSNTFKKYSSKHAKDSNLFANSTTRDYIITVGLCPFCLDIEIQRLRTEQLQNDPEYQEYKRKQHEEYERDEKRKEEKEMQKEEKRKKNEAKKEASKSIQQKELEEYEREYLNRFEKEKVEEEGERRADAQIIINKMIDDGALPEELEREGAYWRLAGYASSKMPDQQGFKCVNCNFENNLDETSCAWCNHYLSYNDDKSANALGS